MRQAFIKTLVEGANKDSRIYLLVADIGYGLVEPFSERYPDRFINVGVAEQNMIGIATGLALSGKIVFCYSIANFPTLRCLEQIRNDACYHNANVNIVSGGGGLAYGALGMSHHATEDLAVMRVLPNMTVVAPGDPVETELAVKKMAKGIGACYLRLGKTEPIAHKISPDFKIGKAITMRDGVTDVMLITTGSMVHFAMVAANQLERQGISAGVISMHTLKPLDVEKILLVSRETEAIITIEEHSIIGGLGSAVAEVLADENVHVKLKRMGIEDKYCTQVGDRQELLEINHLTVEDIVNEAMAI